MAYYNRLLLPNLPSAPIEIGDYAVVHTNWDPASAGSYAVVSTNVDYKVPMGDAAISIPCRGISYINGHSLPNVRVAATANFYVENSARKIYNIRRNTDGTSAEKGMNPHSYNTR